MHHLKAIRQSIVSSFSKLGEKLGHLGQRIVESMPNLRGGQVEKQGDGRSIRDVGVAKREVSHPLSGKNRIGKSPGGKQSAVEPRPSVVDELSSLPPISQEGINIARERGREANLRMVNQNKPEKTDDRKSISRLDSSALGELFSLSEQDRSEKMKNDFYSNKMHTNLEAFLPAKVSDRKRYLTYLIKALSQNKLEDDQYDAILNAIQKTISTSVPGKGEIEQDFQDAVMDFTSQEKGRGFPLNRFLNTKRHETRLSLLDYASR